MSTTTLAFCEPSTASTISAEHIRIVGEEGLKPGGGIRGTALCGRDLHLGWDIPGRDVTAQTIQSLAALPAGSPNPLCPRCAQEALQQLT